MESAELNPGPRDDAPSLVFATTLVSIPALRSWFKRNAPIVCSLAAIVECVAARSLKFAARFVPHSILQPGGGENFPRLADAPQGMTPERLQRPRGGGGKAGRGDHDVAEVGTEVFRAPGVGGR